MAYIKMSLSSRIATEQGATRMGRVFNFHSSLTPAETYELPIIMHALSAAHDKREEVMVFDYIFPITL